MSFYLFILCFFNFVDRIITKNPWILVEGIDGWNLNYSWMLYCIETSVVQNVREKFISQSSFFHNSFFMLWCISCDILVNPLKINNSIAAWCIFKVNHKFLFLVEKFSRASKYLASWLCNQRHLCSWCGCHSQLFLKEAIFQTFYWRWLISIIQSRWQ